LSSLLPPEPSVARLVVHALEEAFQDREAGLYPLEHVPRLVSSLQPEVELPSGDVASEGESLELSAQPRLVTRVQDRCGHPALWLENGESRLGAPGAAAPL